MIVSWAVRPYRYFWPTEHGPPEPGAKRAYKHTRSGAEPSGVAERRRARRGTQQDRCTPGAARWGGVPFGEGCGGAPGAFYITSTSTSTSTSEDERPPEGVAIITRPAEEGALLSPDARSAYRCLSTPEGLPPCPH